jgi:hypothetical protein
MKFRFCLSTFVALASLTLALAAKADTFVYDVTSHLNLPLDLHVRFELPSFEQDVVNQTVFDVATASDGTINSFSISGGTTFPSPDWTVNTTGGITTSRVSPSFNGPGTFTATLAQFNESTTVTITDIPSSVPEPSSWILLSLAVAASGTVVRTRRI